VASGARSRGAWPVAATPCFATDLDGEAARATAEEIGGGAWSLQQDVREPEGHRATAAEAAARGGLQVWVNNAGVMRAKPVWEHPDADVKLQVDANVLGVMWGSRAAVDAMREHGGDIINIASMSAFGPIVGLAVYGATKHAVLGFTTSLQGDLAEAGIPILVHAICPDAANTAMVQGEQHEPAASMLWSGWRLLTADEVAERAVGLIESKRVVLAVPAWRAAIARFSGMAPRAGLALERPVKRMADRRRQRG
jgi:NAD(P)-dependent dehydrogenase (short-subunit alcohol dehydrogenase family)